MSADRPQNQAVLPKILILEDELLLAMALKATLGHAGYDIVGPMPDIPGGCEAARTAPLDIALLDVNLNGDKVFPVADILAARGVPFVFLTGYNTETLPARHRHRPMIVKPCRPEVMVRMLADAMRASIAGTA
jgi:DNA-binding response OmpR family regulator